MISTTSASDINSIMSDWEVVTSTPRSSHYLKNSTIRSQIDANCIQSLFGSRPSMCDIPSTIVEQSFDNQIKEEEDDDEDSLSNESPSFTSSPLAAVVAAHAKKRRNSLRRRRSLNRLSRQTQNRREQRNIAYSRFRKMEDPRKSLLSRRLSKRIGSGIVISPPVYFEANDDVFQSSQVEIDSPENAGTACDVNQNFEQLIVAKASECPFDAAKFPTPKSNQSPATPVTCKDPSLHSVSGQSMNSTTASNHRTGAYVSSHKIPHVVRHEPKKRRSVNQDSQASLHVQPNINILDMLICFRFDLKPILFVFYTCFVCILAILIYRYLVQLDD